MNAMTDNLHAAIARALDVGGLAGLMTEFEIETDLDEFGDEFLRVVVKLKPTERDIDAELEAALERIEEAVALLDSRYPSVRFLDAA